MAASTSAAKGAGNAKRNVYQIGGISVDFPHKAYGSQLAFMGRVISTLDRAQKQGHCHALLESPTGTGKTLSLLCSTLSWQKSYSSRYSALKLAVGKDAHAQTATGGSDPFVDGGGFIPEPEPSQNTSSKLGTEGEQRERAPPRIYYASRTHTQISQVINEFRKTSYRVPMAVLASRKHYCTNQVICRSEDVNENCKKLLKDEKLGCAEFKNANRVKEHHSIKRGGHHEVHDIEDLVKIGRNVKGCSYFGARSLAAEGYVVFCPYNYVINPMIRKAMEIDLKGHILILDEAHNIEDMARDAASIDIDEDTLHRLLLELGELCHGPMGNSETYQPLHDMVQAIISWIGRKTDDLGYHDFEHYSSCWTGESAVRELADSGICLQSFTILEGCAKKAVKDYSEGGSEHACLSGMPATLLEGLFSSLSYLFSGGGIHSTDYQLVLQRYGKKEGNNAKSWVHTLNLWCLNPGIVFKEMADLSLSIILTSGTLSPMGSFSSELGVQFEVCMEAPHVINVKSQLFAAVISRGPQDCRLNASYKTSDGYAFQDELGSSLEEIFKAVPGGVLVFFPSYKFLEKLHSRWRQTGKWSLLNAQKLLFIEPRGNAGDFDATLKAYFGSVRGSKSSAHGKVKDRQKRSLTRFQGMHLKDSADRRGAAFLAVCRGKVSEGVNFSDDDARAVIIVGIPFPSINDLQVALKKKYNDAFRSTKSLLGGSEWYCHQAFRALNQAAGRCIRHSSDYGAVIFLDERFEEDRNRAYISKWIGHSIKQFGPFRTMLDELRQFYLNAKEAKAIETTRIKPRILSKYGNFVPKPRQKKIFGEGAKREEIVLQDCERGVDLASNSDQFPLEESCSLSYAEERSADESVHDPPVEESPLGVSTACHKRKTMADLDGRDSDHYDDVAVKPSFEDSEEKCLELEHHEIMLPQSCPFNSVVEEPARLPDAKDDDVEVNGLTKSTNLRAEEKLHLRCSACRSSLGLSENRFLVPCSVVASSKPGLSFFLKNGFTGMHSPESLLKTERVPVAIVDVWNVDRRVLGGTNSGESMRPDIWSDEEGCVFRPIYCPFCRATSALTLGLQIMATDASNAHLLNKVYFLHERLLIEPDLPSKNTIDFPRRDSMEVGRSSFAGESKNSPSQSRSNSKLRLPRKGRD